MLMTTQFQLTPHRSNGKPRWMVIHFTGDQTKLEIFWMTVLDKDMQHSTNQQTSQSSKTQNPSEIQEAEAITLGPDLVGKSHYFRLQRDRDGMMVAQCQNCPMGYSAQGVDIKDGHIYIDNIKVI